MKRLRTHLLGASRGTLILLFMSGLSEKTAEKRSPVAAPMSANDDALHSVT
jgi:hypothetical protein